MDKNAVLRTIPGLDRVLEFPEIKELLRQYPSSLVKEIIRSELAIIRHELLQGASFAPVDSIIRSVSARLEKVAQPSLKKVINATGVIIHTNLGRAPYGREILTEVVDVLSGYNNLEFNLQTGIRGSRYDHVVNLLCTITGAEDALVVNNNAAALLLILRTFARRKEVLISRGELIEIGGSFRLPSIMQSSDCKMVEVGTTNKTRISDYADKVSPKTRIILKAHHSNFVIKGFVESVEHTELASFARENGLISVFDLGNGLINQAIHPLFNQEQDAKSAIQSGVDLVCFSGDKLLGGPQAGIILGSKKLIGILKKEQITRALRVDKITLALLEAVCKRYLAPDLSPDLQLFKFLARDEAELMRLAGLMQQAFDAQGIITTVISSEGRFGGGTMPEAVIASKAIQLNFKASGLPQKEAAEFVHFQCMLEKPALVGLLIKGNLSFNILTIFEDEIPALVNTVARAIALFKTQSTQL